MKHAWVVPSGLFLLHTLAGCGATGTPPPPPPPISQDSVPVHDLRVSMGCSETAERVAMARLQWWSSHSLHQQQRIEVAVTPDGFATQTFAAVAVLGPARSFRQVDTLAHLSRPAVDSLEVVGVVRSAAGDSVAVDVARLEPRVNYSWRIRTQTGTTSITSPAVLIQAPVCISDG